MDLIDISVPLTPLTPTWPGCRSFEVEWTKRMDKGDAVNSSQIFSDVHAGTHVDAPLHFLPDGKGIDELGLDTFVGHAVGNRQFPMVGSR